MTIRSHHHFMLSYTRSILSGLKRPVFIYLFSISLTLQFVLALFFYFLEHEQNKMISEFFDAFYYTVTVMTGVGLGDIYPVTTLGKILTIAMMLLGTAIFVSFTAILAVLILETELKHSKSQ